MFAKKPLPFLLFSTKLPFTTQFSTAISHSFFPSFQGKPSLSQTTQAHARIIISGHSSDSILLGKLLSFLALTPSIPFHYSLFIYQSIQTPTVFASNNLIRCFAKSQFPLNSVNFYSSMLERCISPNNYTFTFLIQACAKGSGSGSGSIEGVQVHGQVVKLGFGDDVYVRNSLIHFYSACYSVESAKQVFDESMGVCDVVSWNSMLAGFAKDGQVYIVEKMFDEMPERDVISWNTMIMAYVHNGKLEEGLECFRRMRGFGLTPNEATLVTILSAIAQLGLIENGKSIHSIIDSLNVPITITLGTALVDMYAKCGCIEQCRHLFDKMAQRDISTWNAMICGLASHGLGKEALALFDSFLNEGFRPENVTFIGLLNACSRAGLVEEGREFFRLMTEHYGIEPETEHFGCMVDLLGRAGLVSEAIEMIESKVASPDPVLWATLVSACRIHGLIELGEEIGGRLIELNPSYEGHYVQLASIYARSRKWDDVVRVRKLMVERNTGRVAGWSLIEAQGKVHQFVAGDRDHVLSLQIYQMLENIENCIAEAGYVSV
ncbi:pentatricopeptide repeat-containing protein At5g66520-like [Euphorbia lathyris]|uniref:pentatricopeptide repeat-containing protein At5g66520-like n=1 Tax=Euphorbia lathyris TaxID=212925 RepID=UPI0033132962